MLAVPPDLSGTHLKELRSGFACAMGEDRMLERLADQGRPVSTARGATSAEEHLGAPRHT